MKDKMKDKILIIFDSLDGELRYLITDDEEWLLLNGIYINSSDSTEDSEDLLNEKLSKVTLSELKPLIDLICVEEISRVISIGFLP
jgi:hypothetical protein